jgi:hypothetical protein
MELKGEDKHGVYVRQIGNLFENIQLVDPTGRGLVGELKAPWLQSRDE